jgi:ankyrin repeat protein
MFVAVQLAGWQTAGGRKERLLATKPQRTDAELLESLPAWVNDAAHRLHFAREHLALDDAGVQSLVDGCPQYWSVPLQKTLLPRHAFLTARRRGHFIQSEEALSRLLLRPKSDAQFAEAVCSTVDDEEEEEEQGACCADVLDDYTTFAKTFRKGGLEAARTGDVVVLAALYAHGYDPCEDRDRNGASALHYAAGHGHVECCALLCKHENGGLHVDDRAADGATPLHWAVAGVTSRRAESGERHGFGTGGHRSTTEWLIRHGADVRATTLDGNSVVHWCAWAGQKKLLAWLAAQVNRRQPSGEDAPSLESLPTEATHVRSASLRDSAASQMMRALNHKGCSAAHWAASGGDLETCIALAEEYGVDFSEPNIEGNTPLTKAIEHGREPVVTWLLTSGRCETAVGEAAGYAARLAARHSADDVTERVSELLQSYLVARHYLQCKRDAAAMASVDFRY